MLSQSTIDIAQWLLDTSKQALIDCERDPINRAHIAAGQIAWDDCCGMLVVAPERVYRSQSFPAEDGNEELCFDGYIAIEYVILLVRCVPGVDERGRAPSAIALQEAYENLLGDAAVVYNAVTAPIPEYWIRATPTQAFVGASGGCIAAETRVVFGIEQSQFAICCAEPAPHEPGDAICRISAKCVQFEPCGPLLSTNVQDAICEILTLIDESESAAETSFEPCDPLTSTNVQDAICELVDIVENIPAGPPGPPGAGGALGYYGSFYDLTDQDATINTPTPMLLGSTAEANGVSIVGGSQITFANAGTYDIQFSAQLHHRSGGGSGETVQIWLAKNGTPVPDTATQINISSNRYNVPAWDFLLTVAAGDNLELIWQTDNDRIRLEHLPASGGTPAIPSVIATVMQVMYTQLGPQGPSGVVSVTAPITNSGTSTAANVGIATGNGLTTSGGSLVADFGSTSTTVASGDRGLPTGGTTGQALVKSSATDYDTGWAFIPTLAYPADTAYPNFSQTPFSFGGSAFAPTLNTLYFTQVFIRSVCTVVALHTRVIGSATPNSVFRLGLYNSQPNGRPSNLLVDAGTIDASTTGFKSIGSLSVPLTPGLYYAAFVVQGAANPTTYNLVGWPTYQISTSATTQQHERRAFFAMTNQTGALPASWSGTNPESGTAAPHIVLERS